MGYTHQIIVEKEKAGSGFLHPFPAVALRCKDLLSIELERYHPFSVTCQDFLVPVLFKARIQCDQEGETPGTLCYPAFHRIAYAMTPDQGNQTEGSEEEHHQESCKEHDLPKSMIEVNSSHFSQRNPAIGHFMTPSLCWITLRCKDLFTSSAETSAASRCGYWPRSPARAACPAYDSANDRNIPDKRP